MQTATKRKTHVAECRSRAREVMEQVLDVTGISEETYCWFKYMSGLAYLQSMGFAPYDVARLERHRLYWAWWKNQWTIRDEFFLERVYGVPAAALRSRWRQVHDIGRLTDASNAAGQAMNDSYSLMIEYVHADVRWNRAIETELEREGIIDERVKVKKWG